jgi:hypothetical protein
MSGFVNFAGLKRTKLIADKAKGLSGHCELLSWTDFITQVNAQEEGSRAGSGSV